jgi:hypothetical protein
MCVSLHCPSNLIDPSSPYILTISERRALVHVSRKLRLLAAKVY